MEKYGDFKRWVKLGNGAFGDVYKAKDQTTGQAVAIKKIDLSNVPYKYTELRALPALWKFKDPNIVKIVDLALVGTDVFIVMEICNGGDFAAYIFQTLDKSRNDRTTKIMMEQVLKGLAVLEKHHIVHRDLKPANIVLHSRAPPVTSKTDPADITLKITDFGLSKVYDAKRQDHTHGLGTPGYIAPEVAARGGDQYDHKVDMWSFGIIMYETAFGEFALHRKTKEQHYHQMVEDFAKNLHSKQNTHLSQLIRNCLKVDPAERMNSKSALAHRFITGPVSPDLDGLMPNQRLNKGASLFSKNRIRELAYQDDGNLVLYDRSGGTRKPLWASDTWKKPSNKLEMQGDGNLVIYNNTTAVWASNTHGYGARLLVRDEDVVIYIQTTGKCIWQQG